MAHELGILDMYERHANTSAHASDMSGHTGDLHLGLHAPLKVLAYVVFAYIVVACTVIAYNMYSYGPFS